MASNDKNSTIIKQSFDPWGRYRNLNDWTYNSITFSFPFERGYCGHEYIKTLGLINMPARRSLCTGGNGRVYDSKLGRFLSADKFVQDAGSTQNYNRYSYCLNNPLKYSDPSGWLVAPKTYSSWDWDENFNIDWATGRGWEGNAGGGGAQEAGWGGNNSEFSTDFGRKMGHNYNYNWSTGKYQDGGNEVSWKEVYHNYVVPHSFWSGSGEDGLNAGIDIMNVQYGATSVKIKAPLLNVSTLAEKLILPENDNPNFYYILNSFEEADEFFERNDLYNIKDFKELVCWKTQDGQYIFPPWSKAQNSYEALKSDPRGLDCYIGEGQILVISVELSGVFDVTDHIHSHFGNYIPSPGPQQDIGVARRLNHDNVSTWIYLWGHYYPYDEHGSLHNK